MFPVPDKVSFTVTASFVFTSVELIKELSLNSPTAPENPAGFEGGALDFASSPFAWVIFHLTYSLKWIGSGILVLCTLFLMIMNRRAIIKYQKSIKN